MGIHATLSAAGDAPAAELEAGFLTADAPNADASGVQSEGALLAAQALKLATDLRRASLSLRVPMCPTWLRAPSSKRWPKASSSSPPTPAHHV